MLNSKITCRNGFRAIEKLNKAATDPRIAEIEGEGCDEGRVFIHLVKGFWFGPSERTSTRTVGDALELFQALCLIEVDPREVKS